MLTTLKDRVALPEPLCAEAVLHYPTVSLFRCQSSGME